MHVHLLNSVQSEDLSLPIQSTGPSAPRHKKNTPLISVMTAVFVLRDGPIIKNSMQRVWPACP